MESPQVILVTEHDEPIGAMEKMEAHERGLLHRAFSVFIFNKKGELLLQQRALDKYHSGGQWSNTCCSHPQPGEETLPSALKRLRDEMGFTTPIEKQFDFIYSADFHNGLSEFEFDHVFTGEYEGAIDINKAEVMDYCYKSLARIQQEIKKNQFKYTIWFKALLPEIEPWWKKRYKKFMR
jgi:isopentenyl-diphosphate delta-isomerase